MLYFNIFVCQSKMTSHFCNDIFFYFFGRGEGGEGLGACSAGKADLEGTLEQNIKVNDIFLQRTSSF